MFKGEDGIPRDDEAHDIWRRLVPAERIAEMGAAENFWAMGDTGPCGRCSEVHYHRGGHLPCAAPTCRGIDCDCDRYVEIWNNVFMEFERRADGSLAPLPAPSIDTGMGLERIVAVLQDKLSNYDTDLFTPLLSAIGERAGTAYGPLAGKAPDDPRDVSLRVIADHLRAITFLIADGVVPSNEWRGYVLRKIMRRAMRHGKKLGLTEPFLHDLTGVVIAEMGSAYPELEANRDVVVSVVRREEEQFERVLRDGLPRLETALAEAAAGARPVGGDTAFRLYDTFGVPLDFIKDLAQSRGVGVDRAGFEQELEAQRARARAGAAFGGGQRAAFTVDAGPYMMTASGEPHFGPQAFTGYDGTSTRSGVTHLFRRDGEGTRLTGVEALEAGEAGYVVLEQTPFYLEAGGQVSDTGRLLADGVDAAVDDVVRLQPDWPRMHVTAVREGALRAGRRGRGRSGRRAPRRHPPQPYGDAPAARRPARRRRQARAAGRVARRARSPALRHHAPRAGRARRSCARSSVSSAAMSSATWRSRPRSGRPRRRLPQGPWRCSARSTATGCASSPCRASPSSCAAAPTAGRPATSARSSSRTRAAWRPGSGASKP